ncbi:sensor domain-containing protein [Mycobacterium sp. NPDC051198]
MTTQDPFGGNPFGQYPTGQPPYGGPPMVPGPPQPQGPPPHGEVNSLATLSVVFAFVFAPAGAVLGHLGLSQIKRTGQRGRDRALVGLALSYAVIVLVVVALVVWAVISTNSVESKPVTSQTSSPSVSPTSTSSLPPEPTVTAKDLPSLVPNLAEMRDILNDDTVTNSQTQTRVQDQPPEIFTFDPAECAASFMGLLPQGYAGSDYREAYATTHVGADNVVTAEGVVRFPDAAAAEQALAGYQDVWRRCTGRVLKVTSGSTGRAMEFNLGAPENNGGVTSLVSVSPGTPEVVMSRAIAVKANVLVDTQVWAQRHGREHVIVANHILDKIPG